MHINNWFFFVFLIAINLQAKIVKIHSFNDVDFDMITPTTLVMFDVDETLIQPNDDTYLINQYTQQGFDFDAKLRKIYPQITDWDYIESIRLKEGLRPLIETCIIEKIKQLQSKNIPVIACTFMKTGCCGKQQSAIPSYEEWRYEHLKSLGFEGSFSDQIFTLPSCNSRKPLFYKGILATDNSSKGNAVANFLPHIKLQPKTIIMFDDKKQQLEDIANICVQLNIPFIGYWYAGAKQKEWNEELVLAQADYLINHKKWLGDSEIKKIIQNKNLLPLTHRSTSLSRSKSGMIILGSIAIATTFLLVRKTILLYKERQSHKNKKSVIVSC